jgi:hypothetical protein
MLKSWQSPPAGKQKFDFQGPEQCSKPIILWGFMRELRISNANDGTTGRGHKSYYYFNTEKPYKNNIQ